MTTPACPGYAGYRFPAEIISHAVWLYFRFPLSLRMVDELLAARHPRQPRDRTPVGAQVRPGVRKPDPPQAAYSRRQVAYGQGRADDRGREALAVARGRSERDGAGHPCSKPARHAGRQASAAQAAEAAVPGASCHGDRQAGELWSGQVLSDALGRAQEAQGPE